MTQDIRDINKDLVTSKDIENAWDDNKKILAVSYQLIDPLNESFLDDDEFENLFADFDDNKFVQESIDIFEGIENFNTECKNYETVVVDHNTEKFKYGIDVMSTQGHFVKRFRKFCSNIQNSMNQSQGSIDDISTALNTRARNATNELDSIEIGITDIQQELTTLKSSQVFRELDAELSEKKKVETTTETVDTADIHALSNLLGERRNELAQLKLVSQPKGSPQPFFTQAYNEPRNVRNSENFVTQV